MTIPKKSVTTRPNDNLGLNLNYDKNFEKKNTSQHLLNVQDHEYWKNVICCINDIKVFFSRKAYHKV